MKKWNKSGMLSQFIGGMVTLVVGIVVFSIISELPQKIKEETNIDPLSSTLLGYVPLIFIIVVIAIVLFQIYSVAKYLVVEEDSSNDEEIKSETPKKQTYFQYVKERLSIERMMRK